MFELRQNLLENIRAGNFTYALAIAKQMYAMDCASLIDTYKSVKQLQGSKTDFDSPEYYKAVHDFARSSITGRPYNLA